VEKLAPGKVLLAAVAARYVGRCRVAGDRRSDRELLEEIVQPQLAARLAYLLSVPWA
jgi:hypothetical protein